MTSSPHQSVMVIPRCLTADGSDQLFRVPVSAAAGTVFMDASKQQHVIPQAVLVSSLYFFMAQIKLGFYISTHRHKTVQIKMSSNSIST
jgi:hypothetical protein